MSNKISLDDDMPFDEKDRFWNLIYDKVSNAVKKKHTFAIIFHTDEGGLDNEEGYSIIIRKEDYEIFLKNFLLWSEDLERYEICSEVKKLQNKLKKWNLETID